MITLLFVSVVNTIRSFHLDFPSKYNVDNVIRTSATTVKLLIDYNHIDYNLMEAWIQLYPCFLYISFMDSWRLIATWKYEHYIITDRHSPFNDTHFILHIFHTKEMYLLCFYALSKSVFNVRIAANKDCDENANGQKDGRTIY